MTLEPTFAVAEEDLDARTRVLTVSGEIHIDTAERFSERLDRAISGAIQAIVLDFTRVEFIDSTGLSVLLGGARKIALRRGRLSLACGNPTVLRLFTITGLDQTLDIRATRGEAIAAVLAY